MPPFVPGIVPGTNWVCPRDKPGFAGLPLCKIRRKPGFVPGFHRVCPRDKPGEIPGTNPGSSQDQPDKKVYVYVAFSCLIFFSFKIGGRKMMTHFSLHKLFEHSQGSGSGPVKIWKATKEYLNRRGTKIRVFRVCFWAPFPPSLFPYSSPLFPLSCPFSPSSPPTLSPFSDSRKTLIRYPFWSICPFAFCPMFLQYFSRQIWPNWQRPFAAPKVL